MAARNYHRHDPVLPWSETGNDRSFRKVLHLSLGISILIGIIIPYLPVPEPEQKKPSRVSPRIAKLIIEKQKPQPVITEVKPRMVKQKVTRTYSDNTSIDKPVQSGSGDLNSRSLLTPTDGTSPTGRRNTVVKSNRNDRGEAEIALVFEKNRGAIRSLYNSALRKYPDLQGKLVLELTIAPNGRVIQCRIISSELDNTSLERKLVARIKRFRFMAKRIKTVTVTYPIDFLPS